MTFQELENWINNSMHMEENKNYQPISLKFLLTNNGQATKKDINRVIEYANPGIKSSWHGNMVLERVFSNEKNNITKVEGDIYKLIDYENLHPGERSKLIQLCDDKIRQSTNPINPRIILFSISNESSFEHFNNTVKNPVKTKNLEQTILSKYDELCMWGSVSSQLNKWWKIQRGDILLFFRDKKYIAGLIVEGIENNRNIAEKLWGLKDESGVTWEYMIFGKPENYIEFEIDYMKLNGLLDYDDFSPIRNADFTTVRVEVIQKIIEKHGGVNEALESIGIIFPRQNIKKITSKIDSKRLLEEWELIKNDAQNEDFESFLEYVRKNGGDVNYYKNKTKAEILSVIEKQIESLGSSA